MQSANPAVALRGIGKVFESGVVALDALDLTAGSREFVSVLGPSGCGKSTALRIMAGLTPPTAGDVIWAEGAAPARRIGFVFQEPTLMPWASVAANVRLPLKLAGMSATDAVPAVGAALARVGLADMADAYPRELSGGMKMRVSIARALVTRPQVLLMDEPFAALDEITRFQLNDDLLALWQAERFTAIFVTHSVFESVFLSTRIIVMAARPGRVFEEMAVEVPYPRSEAFRTSPEYAALCRQASAVLERAMLARPAEQATEARHGGG